MKKIFGYFKVFCALVLNLLKDIFERSKIPFCPNLRFTPDRGPRLKVLKMGLNRLRASAVRNQHSQSNCGYIMILTLLMVGAAMMIVTYVGHRGSFYLPFSHMLFDREKAEMLALGGIQVAIAQLAKVDEKEAQPSSAKATADRAKESQSASDEQAFLTRILPTLNRWQQFDLKEETDGVDGQIKICVMCEEGKINLNRIVDWDKGTFKGEGPGRSSQSEGGWKVIMQELCKSIEKFTKTDNLFPALEKIIKDAKYEFNDATELITRKEFAPFKDILFYEPPTQKKQETVYLTDIFTVWSSSEKIEPWLFSDSLNALLGLPRVEVDDIKKRKEQIQNWVKNFKVQANWQQDWTTMLLPIYGKELRTLPKYIDSMLSTNFAPRFFSVLVEGKVGEITQRMYAILERNKSSQGDVTEYDVIMKKLYWL